MPLDDSGYHGTFNSTTELGSSTLNGDERTTLRDKRLHNRNIREKYQDLKTNIEHCGAEDDETLKKSLNDVENYFQEVQAPREAIYDSTVVNLQSRIINRKAQMLHTNLHSFVPKIFVEKLRQHIKEKRATPKKPNYLEVWQFLGRKSGAVINATPPFQLLYGTFEPGIVELKKRIRKPRAKDDHNNVVEKPIAVDASQTRSAATEEAERILSILNLLCKKHGQLCYFDFVINPNSFSETIENMFYVSILVKEAAVHLYLDDDNLPFIEPVSKSDAQKSKLHGNFTQSILSISYQEWKEIVREFNLMDPLIPSRQVM